MHENWYATKTNEFTVSISKVLIAKVQKLFRTIVDQQELITLPVHTSIYFLVLMGCSCLVVWLFVSANFDLCLCLFFAFYFYIIPYCFLLLCWARNINEYDWTGWFGIRIMCPSGATCLPVDFASGC